MAKKKTRKVYLTAPEGVKIKRYNVDGQTRFTAPGPLGGACERLVAIHNGEKFTYLHPAFKQ